MSGSRIVWLAFAIIIAIVYLFALGSFPLVGPDEPRYAQVAREMYSRGDWITPTLGGANWFEKPALLYWLQIVFYKIFGVSEFAARLGSALFGLGTIFSLWILGKSVQSSKFEVQSSGEESRTPTNDFANWLALIAASSIGLLVFARGASFDIILTFPITAALVAFFIFDQTERKNSFAFRFSLFAFYFFIGAAILAKGLVGIVFPFAIVAFYHLLSRKLPNKTFVYSLLWGTILSLLVAASWYLPVYRAHGWTFVDEFFIQHHFQRFTSDKYRHHQPFWFFFLVLPLMTLPWLPFFLASIWDFFKVQSSRFKVQSSKVSPRLRVSASPVRIFAFAWLLVPMVFFSFSGSKLPGYILPALPAALVLTAHTVYEFVRADKKRQVWLQASAFLVFVVVALLLQFAAPRFAARDSVKNLIETTNAKGYATEKIVNLYTVSHNAEFYAPDRLVRDGDGKLKRYDDVAVLIRDLEQPSTPPLLVLVSHGSVKELTETVWLETEVLADNGETAIVLVKIRNRK